MVISLYVLSSLMLHHFISSCISFRCQHALSIVHFFLFYVTIHIVVIKVQNRIRQLHFQALSQPSPYHLARDQLQLRLLSWNGCLMRDAVVSGAEHYRLQYILPMREPVDVEGPARIDCEPKNRSLQRSMSPHGMVLHDTGQQVKAT
jgi:hypothetical protein